ncbi:MAG: barstar family protein [Myxococcales bacterium FL481]|nr:MAG: barstar family protein [Myxococcales bacterium FL481]
MTVPWVHIWSSQEGFDETKTRVDRLCPNSKLRTALDGQDVGTLPQFYERIEQAVPLIRGLGRNLNALIDLFRTFGWGENAGGHHSFLWYHPEVLLQNSPQDFGNVLDSIVGVSKELVCGEETDPAFDPANSNDWIPTRLEIILAFRDPEAADGVAGMAKRLSDAWKDEFSSLDILVDRLDFDAA